MQTAPTKETHVFIGMFRPIYQQWKAKIQAEYDKCRADQELRGSNIAITFMCPKGHHDCGVVFRTRCYEEGCYDEPVYKTHEEIMRSNGGFPGAALALMTQLEKQEERLNKLNTLLHERLGEGAW